MPKQQSKKTTTTTLPIGTTTSSPTTIDTSAVRVPGGTTTATTLAAALPTVPPDVVIPAVPGSFTPVVFKDYWGWFPKAGQITAAPGAIIELNASTSYDTTFGPAVPPASQIATELTLASRWSAMRIATEALLVYVRSNEAITWKTSLSDLEKLDAIFQVVATQNPVLVAEFPELAKMLDVPKVAGRAGASTRARKAKADLKALKSAATPPATEAPVASAVSPVTPSGGTGGATH